MRLFLAAGLGLLLAMSAAPVAAEPDAPEATTITVTTTADELNADGDCSLREAVEASNENKPVDACPAGSGINDVIQLGAGTYTLNRPNGAGLRVTQSLFLRGAGKTQTIIDGNGDRTPFQIVHDEMLVCDGAASGSIKRFSARGEYVNTLVAAGSGGLNLSAGGAIVRGSYASIDGYLYVASFMGGIKRYNRSTGAYVDTLALPGAPGIFAPTDLTFAGGFDFNLYATNFQPNTSGNQPGVWRFNPETATFQSVYLAMTNPANSVVYRGGDFYVTDPSANSVLRFDGATGTPMGTFASGSGLSAPRGLTFGPDGALYVASGDTDSDRVLKFNGTTGAFISTFVTQGSGGLDRPGQIRFGPDGNLYVQSVGTQSILRYNGTTGAFIDVFIADGEGGLDRPTCFYWTAGLGTGPIANLRDITVRNGEGAIFVGDQASLVLSDSILEDNSGGFGGGIGNAGFIQVFDTIIRNNTSFNFGGGISNGACASAQVSGSAIYGNFAPVGGGGIRNDGSLTLYNSTISGNRTGRGGGGILNLGNAYINNATIVDNRSNDDNLITKAPQRAGGVSVADGNVYIRNTLIARNVDNRPGSPDLAPDCNNTITSYRNNLIGNANQCTVDDPSSAGTPFDQVGSAGTPIDPDIDVLADNGGDTPTHRLLTGSPAINAGSVVLDDTDFVYACRERDQRGFVRPGDGRCDIGAYEAGATLPLRTYLALAVK